MSQIELQISSSIFERMVNLANITFYISGNRKEPRNSMLLPANQDLTYLPDGLRYLRWDFCPLKSLPSNFCPSNLVELSLGFSNIEQLWNEDQDVAVVNLRKIDLRWCKNLRKIPNLLGATKLETLWCGGCESLVELPRMTHFISPKMLNLSDCPITKFPEIPTNLEGLSLAGTQILEVPSLIGSLKKLQSLDLRRTKIQNIPSNLVELSNLMELNLCSSNIEQLWNEDQDVAVVNLRKIDLPWCKNLRKIPVLSGAVKLENLWCGGCISLVELPHMTHLMSLKELDLSSCPITEFPEIPTNLEELSLAGTQIEKVPSSISRLHSLASLDVSNCKSLKSLSELPPFLKVLNAEDCTSLERVTFTNHEYVPEFNHEALINFCNCFNLNPDARDNIAAVSMIRIRSIAKRSAEKLLIKELDEDEWLFKRVLFHFHGPEVSNKFKNQNSRISLKLGSSTATTRKDVGSRNFKRSWHCYWSPLIRPNKANPLMPVSEHMFVLGGNAMVHRDMNYTEAIFHFRVGRRFGEEIGEEIQVENCGVHAFYVDGGSFTIMDVGSSIDFSSDECKRCSPDIQSSSPVGLQRQDFGGSMVEEDATSTSVDEPWLETETLPSLTLENLAEIISQPEEVPHQTGVAGVMTFERNVSKILECMAINAVSRIVVYGVCGVGKSRVLRALVDDPKIKREFDLIIWVTVSRNWSPTKIKHQIIHQLPSSSPNPEPSRVLKGNKFLLLLDDVWEWIDPQEIGVPDPSQYNGSIMILATRELQGIVERCCGLPLLIIITGRALSDETNVHVWEHAFNEFSVPGRNIKSRIDDLIELFKFSFHQLKSPSLKSCFLYCALVSQDQEINKSELIEHLITGGWSNAYSSPGHDMVDALLRASLLETNDDGSSIRVRDVLRDLALRILSPDTESRQFLLKNYPPQPLKLEEVLCRVTAGLTEPPTEEEWKQSKMMLLMDNNLSTLPHKPCCPKLLTLFLQRNYQLRVMPDLFFDDMPLLKILNLSKTRIKYLPGSISKLERLETLILRDCERLVKLHSQVGSLKLLQVLDVGGTEIIEFPKEIGNLTSLRHLEVSFYGSNTSSDQVKLPRELISSLQSLETLRISVYPGDNWWKKNVGSFVEEVSSLKKLTSLSIYLPQVESLQLFLQTSAAWKNETLREFKFVVGHDIKFNTSRIPQYLELNYGLMSGQCLRFVNSEKKIPDAIVTVLSRCSAFYLDHHLDISKLSEFGIGNLTKLKYCIISECPKLEAIVDCKDIGTETVS
ncbi:Disease resistance protein [Corchorus capsularis]|uniref:Disease resistance protein n=1 Tax=Corchorus capsularis TaxID=210143 RepID=A0A1R3JXA0_COCAP|nr:Disease resistance protein [Corchorus capsularis]